MRLPSIKHCIVLLSALLGLIIILSGMTSSDLSALNSEKTSHLLLINRTLLDAQSKAVYGIGSTIDSVAFLIEKRAAEYKNRIKEAKRLKSVFEKLCRAAKDKLREIEGIEERIDRFEKARDILNIISVILALLILVLSVFGSKSYTSKSFSS